jgi:hypothetical protein
LKRRCLKWAHTAHSDICNTSYGQKKGRESNWQFDSRPLKVKNRPNFVVFRWWATYRWKDLDENYNFALDLITIRGLHKKLCALKVVGILVAISGLSLGSPETKNHLDVAPVERRRVYYKGEGGGFPQVRAVVNLVCPSCSWFVLAPKVFQLCTNHLVLVLCKSVWVSEACHFVLVPSWSLSTPLYPSIVLWTKERPPTPFPSTVLSLGLTFESLKELGVHHVALHGAYPYMNKSFIHDEIHVAITTLSHYLLLCFLKLISRSLCLKIILSPLDLSLTPLWLLHEFQTSSFTQLPLNTTTRPMFCQTLQILASIFNPNPLEISHP